MNSTKCSLVFLVASCVLAGLIIWFTQIHPTVYDLKYSDIDSITKDHFAINTYLWHLRQSEQAGGWNDSFYVRDETLEIKFDAPPNHLMSVEIELWKYPYNYDSDVHHFILHVHGKSKVGNGFY